ncbi:glutamine synthetase [Parvularcula flava]|uniref:glutamine synthetase n=1 Tax=Aquisalinus luteolus TaxID=1566827 RepID=A0A8J3A554_9PROT|nr:glutamine synthetase beta-grasp domain-containing protein [Aquisalinus luteolus]NHK28893.1 glutamine synthetase [Aquisalinus luteolus]GGH99834.1 glutamine synthetase [Aquisalinus luteolus]
MTFAEYIWLDGSDPVQELRSKTRTVRLKTDTPKPRDFPDWSFDGTATGQADCRYSDCALTPVCVVSDPTWDDPTWDGEHYLVLCEVFNADGTKHVTNTRGDLRSILRAGAEGADAWIGFEQEYTLFRDGRPLGFPKDGLPEPQGRYYCSVGADRAYGRKIARKHAELCQKAGLMFHGLNAESLPGQWEFQIGYRGNDGEDPSLLNAADHLWLARYLLHRVAEEYGVLVSLDNKPVQGNWHGAGMHANFSTRQMREDNGLTAIHDAVELLSRYHGQHIAVYGDRLAERLTGQHETCAITEFRVGNADRGASIRIPLDVEQRGAGYFEDRRPGANADPYRVAARIAETVCMIDTGRPAQAAE